MTELLELHILQNFAPSNLNRDDTGSPKDCMFGGSRRARISSQALKRSMRTYVRENELLPEGHLAERSRRFNRTIVSTLVERGRDAETAAKVVEAALGGMGLKIDEKENRTEYLIFLGSSELAQITELIDQNWDNLSAVAVDKKAKKKDLSAAVPDELRKALNRTIRARGEGGDAVDVALFGRMLADKPDKNQDAACQVAHAISTHKVEKEFDYYTAVDDLLDPSEDAGAGMLGTVEYNSACFYRYMTIDLARLKANLSGDEELLRKGLEAFLKAAVLAIPTGKQNSFAAHNPPSFIALRHRKNGPPINLANAFEEPVWLGGSNKDRSFSAASARKLAEHWESLDGFYGNGGDAAYWSVDKDCGFSKGQAVTTLDDLLAKVAEWTKG
jgi:CRISPR system Cascade subunit CasC